MNTATAVNTKNVIFLVERDNWQKDERLRRDLLDGLRQCGVEIAWEDPAGNLIYRLRRLEKKLAWLPRPIKNLNLRLAQVLYGLTHWSYFQYLYNRKKESIPLRCAHLKSTITRRGIADRTIILSRSSGGRASSLIADELKLKQVICLGYPFRNPRLGDEPERYAHLGNLKTPMLIIQGSRDEYGGLDIQDRYALSPSIELFFVDTDHDFRVDDEGLEAIIGKIAGIANTAH